jgi:hypothetical protein
MNLTTLFRPMRRLGPALIALAALFAFLAVTPDAWAAYGRRANELHDILAKKQIGDIKDRQLLERATDDWLAQRNETLARLVEIAGDGSDSRSDRERAWVETIRDGRARLASTFERAWGSLGKEPSLDAVLYHHLTLVEEDRFLAGLQESRVGEDVDRIIATRKRIDEMTKILDEKWRSIGEQDDALNQQERALLEEIKRIESDAIQVAMVRNRTVAEKIAYWANLAARGLDTANVDVGTVITGVLDPWVPGNNMIRARFTNFQSLVWSQRSGIYPIFMNTRRDTQEFVDKNNFVAAKAAYDLAKDTLERYRSSLASSAQKDDAGELSSDVLGKLAVHLNLTEHIFDTFVSKHRSRFFGPISDETLNKLAAPAEWENHWRELDALQLDAKLRLWRQMTSNWWDVDVSKVTDKDKAVLREQIQGRIDDLLRTLGETERNGKDLLDELKASAVRKQEDLKK